MYMGSSGEPASSLGHSKTMKPIPHFLAELPLSLPPTEADPNLSLEGNGFCGPSIHNTLAGQLLPKFLQPYGIVGAELRTISRFFPSSLSSLGVGGCSLKPNRTDMSTFHQHKV